MLIQRVNRNDAEKIFINVLNKDATANTLGYPVCFDWQNASSLGVAVDQPTTSTLALFAGVTVEDIAANAYGLVQIYGYCASVQINVGANSVSAAGLGVGPANALSSLQTTGYPTDAMNAINSAAPLVVIMENDISGSGYVKAFIRAM